MRAYLTELEHLQDVVAAMVEVGEIPYQDDYIAVVAQLKQCDLAREEYYNG